MCPPARRAVIEAPLPLWIPAFAGMTAYMRLLGKDTEPSCYDGAVDNSTIAANGGPGSNTCEHLSLRRMRVDRSPGPLFVLRAMQSGRNGAFEPVGKDARRIVGLSHDCEAPIARVDEERGPVQA